MEVALIAVKILFQIWKIWKKIATNREKALKQNYY
jgi:hypothetical protein